MVSQHKAELEAWARRNVRIEKNWPDGIKHIPGRSLAYARDKWAGFLKRTRISGMAGSVYPPNLRQFIRITRGLEEWQNNGFTRGELESLKIKFELLAMFEEI